MHTIIERLLLLAPEDDMPNTRAAMIDGACAMAGLLQTLREFPDRCDYGVAEDYAAAVDAWWVGRASPAIAKAEGRS